MNKMNGTTREITEEYLNLFVNAIAKGNPVTYVETDNLLAVAHPELGYLVVQIADKVLTNEEKEV